MKIHLLWKKEEIDQTRMQEDKIAIVFDVLLATSTITSCLASGAKQVIPVMDETEAVRLAETVKHQTTDDVLLTGERDGLTIDGFIDPIPSILNEQVTDKTVILSTTNGTIAIRNAASAKKVYMASLLNGRAVAERVAEMYANETVVVICSGSNNAFCLEDYYGAGYFISSLITASGGEHADLTDSALAAKLFYEHMPEDADGILHQSHVGGMLSKYGYDDDVAYVSQRGVLDVVPRLNVASQTITDESDIYTVLPERSKNE